MVHYNCTQFPDMVIDVSKLLKNCDASSGELRGLQFIIPTPKKKKKLFGIR